MIVSRFHYIMKLRRHYLHSFLKNSYQTDQQRLLALIEGPNPELADQCPEFIPYKNVLDRFLGWQTNAVAHTIKYEDIVGETGSELSQKQIDTVTNALAYLGLEYSANEIEDMFPKFLGVRTATMRKGKAGGWKNALDNKALDLVEEKLSRPLIDMGYHL